MSDNAMLAVWPQAVLYRGMLPDLPIHAYGAASLLAISHGNVRVAPSDDPPASIWLVRSGFAHRTYFGNRMAAVLFFEPDMPLAAALHQLLADQGALACSPALAEQLQDAVFSSEVPSLEQLTGLLEKRLPLVPGGLDSRVASVCRHMRACEGNYPTAAEMAQHVDLSEPRLQHLFKDETGVSMGVFRTVLRMRRAAAIIAEGASLTDAAHGAGFSDSAHFSRRFRKMFGVKPSLVFRQVDPASIHWLAGDD
jgi:AraC-like DNA-binding protein